MTAAPAIDRRAALKARHRRAILAAALQLVHERQGGRFTVDELVERADVARRTVFNHFASIDEVLLTLCADELDVLIDDFVADVAASPVGDGSRASMFDEIATTLRTSDLPSAIASVVVILGEPHPDDPRGRALSDQAFARAGERLVAEVQRRNPAQSALDVQVLVGSLMNGVIVCAEHWLLGGGLQLEDGGRAAWADLLKRTIESVRAGYGPATV